MNKIQQQAKKALEKLQHETILQLAKAYDFQWRKRHGGSYGLLGKHPEESPYYKKLLEHAAWCINACVLPDHYVGVQFLFAKPRNGRDKIGFYDVFYQYSHQRYIRYHRRLKSRHDSINIRRKMSETTLSKVKLLLERLEYAHDQLEYQMDLRGDHSHGVHVELVVSQCKLLDPYYVLCFHQYIPDTSDFEGVQNKLLAASQTLAKDTFLKTAWLEASKDICNE